MSFVAVGALAATAISAGVSMYNSREQARQARAASEQQAKAMAEAESQQQQNFNRQNRNTADLSGLLRANTGGFNTANLTNGTSGSGTLGAGGMLGR